MLLILLFIKTKSRKKTIYISTQCPVLTRSSYLTYRQGADPAVLKGSSQLRIKREGFQPYVPIQLHWSFTADIQRTDKTYTRYIVYTLLNTKHLSEGWKHFKINLGKYYDRENKKGRTLYIYPRKLTCLYIYNFSSWCIGAYNHN